MYGQRRRSFSILLFLLLRIVFISLIVLVPFIISPTNTVPLAWYVMISVTLILLGVTMLRCPQQLAEHFKARSTDRRWFPPGLAIQYRPGYFRFFGALSLAMSLALILIPLLR